MTKLKIALPWIVTALLLAVCLMLPLLFRINGSETDSVSPAPGMSASERADLYYRYTQEDGLHLAQLDGESINNADLIECTRLANTVSSILVMDEGTTRADGPSGTNFYTLADGADTIRIMEYYHEWTADWHNWFTIHIDIDTREIYYLYYSANVQQNGEQYAGLAQSHLESAGQNILTTLGFTDATLEDTGESDGSTQWELSLTDASGDIYRYVVICNIYEDAAPSLLIDLRLTLKEIAAA